MAEKTTSMREISDELYRQLIEEHGFQQAERWRIPGTVHAVAKDNVEITAIDFSRERAGEAARVRVDIHVPVNAREDTNFQTHRCGGRQFLSQREQIVLTRREDIADKIGLILDLAQRGSGILQLCGLEPPPYIN